MLLYTTNKSSSFFSLYPFRHEVFGQRSKGFGRNASKPNQSQLRAQLPPQREQQQQQQPEELSGQQLDDGGGFRVRRS